MSLVYRVGVALTSVSGVGTAVTVPLVLNHGTEGISKASSRVEAKQVPVFENIKKCENSHGDNINFGDKVAKEVCWLVEDTKDLVNEDLADNQKYTQLFQRMWNNPQGIGSSRNTSGTDYCDRNKWIFNGQGTGSESLGLCEGPQSNQQGIMVHNQEKTTVEVCAGVCFEDKNTHHLKTLDPVNKKGNGRKIQFKKLG